MRNPGAHKTWIACFGLGISALHRLRHGRRALHGVIVGVYAQKCREPTWIVWSKNVGVQKNTVRHANFDTAGDSNAVSR